MHTFDSPDKSVAFEENNLDIENSAVSQNMKQPVNLDESLTNTIQSQKTAKSMQIIHGIDGQQQYYQNEMPLDPQARNNSDRIIFQDQNKPPNPYNLNHPSSVTHAQNGGQIGLMPCQKKKKKQHGNVSRRRSQQTGGVMLTNNAKQAAIYMQNSQVQQSTQSRKKTNANRSQGPQKVLQIHSDSQLKEKPTMIKNGRSNREQYNDFMLPPIASATGQIRQPKAHNLNNSGSPEASHKILYEDYPSLVQPADLHTLSKSQSIQYEQYKVSKNMSKNQMKSYDLHQSPAVGNDKQYKSNYVKRRMNSQIQGNIEDPSPKSFNLSPKDTKQDLLRQKNESAQRQKMKIKTSKRNTMQNSRSPQSVSDGQNNNSDNEYQQGEDTKGFNSNNKKVDFQQKNLQKLEALKAKKAQEIKEMEEQRDKMKRRQDKLKNQILKEAEDNRKKKQEQEIQKQAQEMLEAEQQKIEEKKVLTEDEQHEQENLNKMRRFYRNRHTTFIKALLEQKKQKEDAKDQQKQKEERKRQKIKEKALANLNNQEAIGNNMDTVEDRDELPMIDSVVQREKQMAYSQSKKFNRGNSVAAFGNRAMRTTSMSARQANEVTDDTSQITIGSQQQINQALRDEHKASREERSRKMKAAYGYRGDEKKPPRQGRNLQRQGSRSSVRSSHSVKTPMISHKDRIVSAPGKMTLMPSLLKQNQQNEPPEEAFDEEKEQQLLEEARKKKERAKKIREQQEKMLAELKQKKEAKEKEEEDKKRKQEKKLAKARAQCLENFQNIPERVEDVATEDADTQKKKPATKFTDFNCAQAPDNEGDQVSPVKKEKKALIEPDLEAFLKRNQPTLKVFTNITDIKLWKKKHQLEEDTKIFIVSGGYGFLKKSLRKRGWVENKDVNSPCFDFKWTLKSKDIDHNAITNNQLVNHFPKASAITTKVGLMHNLKNLIWFNNIDIETFYPRCYDLALQEEQDDFAQEYKAVKAESWIKRYVRELRQTAQSEEGEIKSSVKPKVIETAIKVSERRLKDLNELIDDPTAFEHLVSPAEWKILGFDELNEKKLQKQKHEKWLTSMNMPLPPRSKKKKKRKVKKEASKQSLHGQEQEEESDSDDEDLEDDDEEDAIDKAIQKKYPDFKQCVQILKDLKKMFPQTGINGEQNIWIIKPAQSSRGRGILLLKNLIEIMELAQQKEFQFIAQKYIENPLIIKNRKFDLRVWVTVTDWNPLTVWLFKKPYVRLPAHDYNPNDIGNNFSHLANNSIAKYGTDTQNEHQIEGNMMFIEELQEYLLNIHCSDVYEEIIEEKLRTVIINTLESVQDSFEYKRGCFELYGFDIMVDEEFNCWLIEVNSSPAMDYSTHVTEKLVKQCLEDTCKILIDYEIPKTAKGKAKVDTGEYELIYKANRVVEKPLSSFGLNLTIAGKQIPDKMLKKW